MDLQAVQKIIQTESAEKEEYLKTANFVIQKILLELDFAEKKERVLKEKLEEIKKEIKLKKINEIINKIS